VSLFFNTIPEHTDEVFLHWKEFKNSGMVEMVPLHLQLLTTNHFHFLIIENMKVWGKIIQALGGSV
jgi:hypothetical protein